MKLRRLVLLTVLSSCGDYAPELKTTHRVETDSAVTLTLRIDFALCDNVAQEDQLECIEKLKNIATMLNDNGVATNHEEEKEL